jgi:hypothetical protein
MNKNFQIIIAALLVATASRGALAQTLGDANTSITGAPVYVEEGDVDYSVLGGMHNQLTISGAVGLPLNPTASMLPKGSARVQANYYKLWDDSDGSSDVDAKIYGIYAATSVSDKLEVSVGYEKLSVGGNGSFADLVGDTFEGSGAALGVKYMLNSPTNPKAVRIAIGAGYSRALYKNTHVYAVASKSFGSGRRIGTAHFGIRYDRFKVNGNSSIDSASSSKASLFAGAEIPIDSAGRFSLVGEIQSKNANEDFGGAMPYSLSLRYQNGSGLGISAGIMRQGVLSDFVDGDSNLFIQVGKTF